jgi:hypothetical protein
MMLIDDSNGSSNERKQRLSLLLFLDGEVQSAVFQ